MSEYIPTIGLEIHAELKTATKMFCRSKNNADETRPNVNICPVCMAHPGTLPVINREAVKSVLRVGVALGSNLADYTEFDRKNYFYPDLPKGFQLSQFEYPLVSKGELAGVAITRIHLEEDTASSMHEEGVGTTIDYNRAGVPLMELVTEPMIHSAEDAGKFARELQLLLRTLGVSEANMEKGEMRVEANISVSRDGTLGTKVEVKNLNSFNTMERAVRYEIKRQISLLEKGGVVEQQTLGWDENKQATFPQRSKEGSADYRYFPDPDLPSLKLSELPEFAHDVLQKSLPELPANRRARYISLGVKPGDADTFVRDLGLGNYFEAVTAGWENQQEKVLTASNYIANDLVKLIRDSYVVEPRDTLKRDAQSRPEMSISAPHFKKIIEMISEKKITSRSAKDLLAESTRGDVDPEVLATEKGLFQVSSDGALEATVADVIAKNPAVASDFNAGKVVALEYLLGQSMKSLKGSGDPEALRRLLRAKLSL